MAQFWRAIKRVSHVISGLSPLAQLESSDQRPQFVHLNLHSEYSLVDSIVRIKPLAKAVFDAQMPAVAVTDHVNMFALVKFYRAAISQGIKPIIGAELLLSSAVGRKPDSRLLLLCQNRQGYLNLSQLISKAYLEGQVLGVPGVQLDWLRERSDGLIALSGARTGNIGQALLNGHDEEARLLAQQWQDIYPDRFYLELQRTGRPQEDVYIERAVGLALDTDLPVVATNEVRFLAQDDFDAHETRVCIHQGRVLADSRRPREYSDQQYLRTPEEMVALFEDIPEAIANTVEIAKRCNFDIELGVNHLPNFPLPAGEDLQHYFRQQSQDGLAQRLGLLKTKAKFGEEQARVYQQRLEFELGVIEQMGFPGYFLIVADFIKWARENDIPVGPGRGSGAGSLVAYALKITEVDPIQFDLLFERFLNPERVSMPDFDIDFCMDGRDQVIDYVGQRYGRERVSQIITYGTMAAKAVVRDVGRALGMSYGAVDPIAKLVPFEVGMTLTKALEQEPVLRELKENDEEAGILLDRALSLEGIARNAGKHAGGVVISPTVLTDYTPLYREYQSTSVVTQLDKDDVESVGLVKFDFLGLRTLTIIDHALKNIEILHPDLDLNIDDIAMDDQATFDLLRRCETTAVFQLESTGMKDLIKRLQPDNFDEIVALVALFRPGPLNSGMVDDYINRKHGRAKVDTFLPQLAPILEPTYGCIVYQEQVMSIAQVLAGYSLGGADMLRRAMGKKKPEEMARQRAIFSEGAANNGIDPETATHIFDVMEKFAEYGFNKSHSVAYALIAYQTAWLKTHHSAAFMAAVLSADMDNTDKVVTLIDECAQMKLEILPPNVNACLRHFAIRSETEIFYGLGAVKGVGEGAIESIVQARESGGPFQDIFDMCARVDLQKANKRVMEALLRAGALDDLGENRATIAATLPVAVSMAEQQGRDGGTGQNDLFGEVSDQVRDRQSEMVAAEPWSDQKRLEGERETLGLFLTGHPIDECESLVRAMSCQKIASLQPDKNTVRVAGLVYSMRTVKTQRGGRIAILLLDDKSARIEVTLFGSVFDSVREWISKDTLVVIEGRVEKDERVGIKLAAKSLEKMNDAQTRLARQLLIVLNDSAADAAFPDSFAAAVEPFRRGASVVKLSYNNGSGEAEIELGDDWRVKVNKQCLQQIERLDAVDRTEVLYN